MTSDDLLGTVKAKLALWERNGVLLTDDINDAVIHKPSAAVLAWLRALVARCEQAEDENANMINAAGCALGTDEALRSSACVEVLARQTEALRGELTALRQRHAEEMVEVRGQLECWRVDVLQLCVDMGVDPAGFDGDLGVVLRRVSQRHAEAVEVAFREAVKMANPLWFDRGYADAAWLASEAKVRLT